MRRTIAIIGGGFGGLAAACLLAKAGHDVTVYEKNQQIGGRVGQFAAKGFRFDTGPSWYLMPEVFEHFFTLLGERLADHIELAKLSPAYRVFDEASGRRLDITSSAVKDSQAFADLEPESSKRLREYLTRSESSYRFALDHLLYKNYDSPADLPLAAAKLSVFPSMHQEAARFFKHPLLQRTVEYPAVFLGSSPYRAPAFYGLLNHCLFSQGVWYPKGGMYTLVEALFKIGKKHGVVYKTGTAVSGIEVTNGKASGIVIDGKRVRADIIISDAGVYHTETALLDKQYRDHTPGYWQKRTWAPSALLLFLGINRQYPGLAHHNLLLSAEWRRNFAEIFDRPGLPSDPSLYVCAPSKTDPSAAPKGCENLFILVPIGARTDYAPAELEAYSQQVLEIAEKQMGLENLGKHVAYKRMFCSNDFATRFNSPFGSGLGLAHTLKQTALFRPSNQSRKVRGLYYVGADVHPGIGLPPVLISAELVYKRLINDQSATPLTSLQA